MVSEWSVVPFSELLSEGTRNGVHKGSEYQGRGTPVIKMGEVYNSDTVDAVIDRDLLEMNAKELDRFTVQAGDLLFCRTSLVAEGVGRVAMVREVPVPTVFASNLIRARLDSRKASASFYRYFFNSQHGRWLMQTIARGTSVTTITGPDICGLEVPRPSLAEQTAIASVLGALDDKIELNRKMSRTFDEMVQAVFDSLIRQEEGTPARLDAVVSLARESVAPLDVEPETPYVGLEHFDGGSTFLSRWDSAEKVTSGKSRFQAGDILFGKLRPYFHKVVLATFDGICSTDVMVLRPVDYAHRNLALGYVNGDAFIARATAQSEGTRMPRTKWRDVAAYEIVVPPDGLLDTFNSLADPVRHRQDVCVREALTLAEMRDALLPRLLSGELRVRDAEAIVEKAV